MKLVRRAGHETPVAEGKPVAVEVRFHPEPYHITIGDTAQPRYYSPTDLARPLGFSQTARPPSPKFSRSQDSSRGPLVFFPNPAPRSRYQMLCTMERFSDETQISGRIGVVGFSTRFRYPRVCACTSGHCRAYALRGLP